MHAGRCDSVAAPRARRGAMGNGLDTMIKYLRRTKRSTWPSLFCRVRRRSTTPRYCAACAGSVKTFQRYVPRQSFALHAQGRNNGSKMRQRRRESMANNDSNSSKLHHHESYLATVQVKPVALPGPPEAHAEVLCLLYLSDDVFSLPLSRLTSLRMSAGAAPLPFVLGELQ
jgi:hypothetical protein